MLIDLIIVVFAISSFFRGRSIGFVRQLGSTLGFLCGLYLGALLEQYSVRLAGGQNSRILLTLMTTLGCALLFLSLGEYLGIRLKQVLLRRHIVVNRYDSAGGAVLAVFAWLIAAWLLAAILATLPYDGLQNSLHNSRILGSLNRRLPSAPAVVAKFGHLIDPNGYPQVFIGAEPSPSHDVALPNLGSLQAAVNRDKASVVKLEGRGCGGIVEGSGFVVGPNQIATNAHVVAGISHPYVLDGQGTHRGRVIYFDPNLDFAVLAVSGLAGRPLPLAQTIAPTGTAAAVIGYPGGGPLNAGPAAVIDNFTASGRSIYGRGSTLRRVYEIRAHIVPGNSGGPLIDADGTVIGVVFAESTTYPNIGYSLTSTQVRAAMPRTAESSPTVSTGQCAS